MNISENEAGKRRQMLVVGLLLSAMLLSGLWLRPAAAQITEVTGSAFGYYVDASFFGGPSQLRGFGQDPGIADADMSASPSVELPSEGSSTPITATDPDGALAQFGPAVIFDSTFMEVSTQGTTGPNGSVSSTATVEEHQRYPYMAGITESSCTASEAGITGSTTLTNATLVLSTDPDTAEPVETISLPVDPEPNTTYFGTIDQVGESFRVVFNEQTGDGDNITVNAVHFYMLGPIAVGDFVIAQSVCGVTSDGSAGGTTTTRPDGGTTTTRPDGGTTTTTRPDSGTTTTTRPDSGTTTTTLNPDPGGEHCQEPTDFTGQLIFQIFRSVSDLLARLEIPGFEQFGCDLNE